MRYIGEAVWKDKEVSFIQNPFKLNYKDVPFEMIIAQGVQRPYNNGEHHKIKSK